MPAALLTLLALVAFAANSILCRMALGSGAIDAASFTTVRLASGAITLLALTGGRLRGGSWASAAALFAYATLFSLAYLRIGAAVGALVLFAAVQVSMIGGSRERPSAAEWMGLVLALGGLALLTVPGLRARPDALGTALMAGAGVAWGVYSLRGRGLAAQSPLGATAGNFARGVPMALAASALSVGRAHGSARGLALAAASGALASGVGYSLWYAALRHLSATRAAIAQLLVPVIAAAAAVVFLAERPTARLVLAGAAILGGVGLALRARAPRT